jgi:hypothetical protein
MLRMPKTKLSRPLQNLIELRGRKTLRSMDRYSALLRAARAAGCFDKVNGPSPGGAAAELGMSRQSVHRAISRGTLDAWYVAVGVRRVFDDFYIFVTAESIERYKANRR